MDPIAILSGYGVGAIVGMTGVGGGSLMTPLLISAFRRSPAVAIGTDLWFAAITKRHARWPLVGRLLAGSIPASIATIGLRHLTGVVKAWSQAAGLKVIY